ncbi:MAG: hypothetical protein ACP5VQ_09535, partial [Phycisphaerae bacterium]
MPKNAAKKSLHAAKKSTDCGIDQSGHYLLPHWPGMMPLTVMVSKGFVQFASPWFPQATLRPWYIAHALAVFLTTLTSNAVYFFVGYELHASVQVRLAMAAGAGLVYCTAAIFGGRLVDTLGQRRVGSV